MIYNRSGWVHLSLKYIKLKLDYTMRKNNWSFALTITFWIRKDELRYNLGNFKKSYFKKCFICNISVFFIVSAIYKRLMEFFMEYSSLEGT